MLTVDYDRLGLHAGDRLLDLGCGFGRHAYEALRLGADVIACDLGLAELKEVRAVYSSMRASDDLPAGVVAEAVNGDATRLPFADGAFDRIIASEVVEHIPDDAAALTELARVLRPGGRIAVTVPAWLPERICWLLSEDYHAPAVEGGHLRIYTEDALRRLLRGAGLVPGAAHHAHALHAPFWWLRCAVGPDRPVEENRLVALYHRLLTWDIVAAPAVTRMAERALNPLIGKSLVVYATKPTSDGGPA
jgi:SAM-dependent methyltransferase